MMPLPSRLTWVHTPQEWTQEGLQSLLYAAQAAFLLSFRTGSAVCHTISIGMPKSRGLGLLLTKLDTAEAKIRQGVGMHIQRHPSRTQMLNRAHSAHD